MFCVPVMAHAVANGVSLHVQVMHAFVPGSCSCHSELAWSTMKEKYFYILMMVDLFCQVLRHYTYYREPVQWVSI